MSNWVVFDGLNYITKNGALPLNVAKQRKEVKMAQLDNENVNVGDVVVFQYKKDNHSIRRVVRVKSLDGQHLTGIDYTRVSNEDGNLDDGFRNFSVTKISNVTPVCGPNDMLVTRKELIEWYSLPESTTLENAVIVARIHQTDKEIGNFHGVGDFAVVYGPKPIQQSVSFLHDTVKNNGAVTFAYGDEELKLHYENDKEIRINGVTRNTLREIIDSLSDWLDEVEGVEDDA